MIDIVEFIFSSFWHWLGTFVLLVVLARWRMIYINISGTKKDKTDTKPSTFWKDLGEFGKTKSDPDPSK